MTGSRILGLAIGMLSWRRLPAPKYAMPLGMWKYEWTPSVNSLAKGRIRTEHLRKRRKLSSWILVKQAVRNDVGEVGRGQMVYSFMVLVTDCIYSRSPEKSQEGFRQESKLIWWWIWWARGQQRTIWFGFHRCIRSAILSSLSLYLVLTVSRAKQALWTG